MNWEAIGAIGEVLGATLVGATLIYLAYQLRQNTSALTSSTFQAVSSSMGFIDGQLTEGFDRSAISSIATGGAQDWWESSKSAFIGDFAQWVDAQLATNSIQPIHVGLGLASGDPDSTANTA